MNQLINDGGDCRTAPATPGLLNIKIYFICNNVYQFHVAGPPGHLLTILEYVRPVLITQRPVLLCNRPYFLVSLLNICPV